MNLKKQVVINLEGTEVENAVRDYIRSTYPELAQGYSIGALEPFPRASLVADGGQWQPQPAAPAVVLQEALTTSSPAPTIALKKIIARAPAFLIARDGKSISVKPGTTVSLRGKKAKAVSGEIKASRGKLKPGTDYNFFLNGAGQVCLAEAVDNSPVKNIMGGFHVSLSGKILSTSFWDLTFRPAAPDPRGMVLVACGKLMFWADIYLMGRDGRSRAGSEIADGYKFLPEGFEKFRQCDAVELAAKHGKQLLSREEFALAADGVEEGKVTGKKPTKTECFKGLTSRFGLEQATGALWVWSRDLDSDGWPHILGGNWVISGYAGPRRVSNDYPDSFGYVGARGRCDHLELA